MHVIQQCLCVFPTELVSVYVFASVCVRISVWRAVSRLPVCRRFIGEADEQGRYPGAARQWPELYLS